MRARKALFAAGCGLLLIAALGVAYSLRGPQLRKLDAIDHEAARQLFDFEKIGDAFRFDEEAVLLALPGRNARWWWKEHPDGFFRLQTNDMGFVETEPTPATKRGERILVVGDSHTQGLANVDETFPNVLEALLNEAGREPPVEVINAGVGYTGPYAYAARLKKYLALQPDVFVAALFSGNDFWDDLLVHYTLEGVPRPAGGEAYEARLERAHEEFAGMLYQGLNQCYRFKHFPVETELAFERVVRSFEEMQAVCAANGIAFFVLVLPSKIDVDQDRPEELAQVLEMLELSPEEAGLSRALGSRFVDEMRRRDIVCLDPADEMKAAETPFFWRRDDHLALAGHRLAAERLQPLVIPWLQASIQDQETPRAR